MDALIKEGLFVGYDCWGLNGSQNSDFVESIFLFLGVELVHFDFLESVDQVVTSPLHLVDCAVGPLAKLAHRYKVSNITHVL